MARTGRMIERRNTQEKRTQEILLLMRKPGQITRGFAANVVTKQPNVNEQFPIDYIRVDVG